FLGGDRFSKNDLTELPGAGKSETRPHFPRRSVARGRSRRILTPLPKLRSRLHVRVISTFNCANLRSWGSTSGYRASVLPQSPPLRDPAEAPGPPPPMGDVPRESLRPRAALRAACGD